MPRSSSAAATRAAIASTLYGPGTAWLRPWPGRSGTTSRNRAASGPASHRNISPVAINPCTSSTARPSPHSVTCNASPPMRFSSTSRQFTVSASAQNRPLLPSTPGPTRRPSARHSTGTPPRGARESPNQPGSVRSSSSQRARSLISNRAVRRVRATRPCPRGTAPDPRWAGSSPAVRAASGPRVRCPTRPAGTTTRGAPRHEIGVRRDGGGRVDLEQRQVAHHVEQPGRPRTVQELCAYGDAARVEAGKLVDGHDPRLGEGSDSGEP